MSDAPPEISADAELAQALSSLKARDLSGAEAICDRVSLRQAEHPECLHIRGMIAHRRGQNGLAVELIQRAVAGCPAMGAYHVNLAAALLALARLDEAIVELREAIRLDSGNAWAYLNLGTALVRRGCADDAVVAIQTAIAIRPDQPRMHSNLGAALRQCGRLDEAEASCRHALELRPDYAEAWNNLGNILAQRGEIAAAQKCHRRAHELRPDNAAFYESLLYLSLWDPGQTPQSIPSEARRWNDLYARPLRVTAKPHRNSRVSDRRLRIGYVSAELREHVTGWNLLPLLANHDRERFEIFCYSGVEAPDGTTRRLAELTDCWRDIKSMSDEEAADLIRADEIDILVDLAMHVAQNRLLVFARKPAPVQVTYLSYCGTTGLEAIDYRLSDPYFDPPGSDLSCYSETTIVLPRCYWAYQPAGPLGEVARPPAIEAGYVTFGCLNNFSKASAMVRELWGRVLLAVPRSRLVIHSLMGSHRATFERQFAATGIEAGRIEFVGLQPWKGYIDTYNRIDIALDPMPYGGGITSCDALAMGVPLVTLRGATSVGRSGCSILSNVGLPELIAENGEEYVRIAVELSQDVGRMTALRASLRERMERSPMRDHKSFTREVEAAYRRMWQEYCEKPALERPD